MAVSQVMSSVDNSPALWADQVSPACCLATLFVRLPQGRVLAPSTCLGDRETVDRKANVVERLDSVHDLGGYRLWRARTHNEI